MGKTMLMYTLAVGHTPTLYIRWGSFCFIALLLLAHTGCTFKGVRRAKSIVYQPATALAAGQALNVFSPKTKEKPWPVLVFVHGGSWQSGNKATYNFLGNRFARRGVVAVIIDYPLSPAQYPAMALSTALAVAWVYKNISRYGGDSSRIFIAGHSAGGHLAALVGTDTTYFNQAGVHNPLKGIVLLDAAGLDMFGYLTKQVAAKDRAYLDVFTSNPQNWKNASALYHLHLGMPPFLIFRAGNTYQSIKTSHNVFIPALLAYQPTLVYKVQAGKHHIGMITQFLNGFNPRYKDIKQFMEKTNQNKS